MQELLIIVHFHGYNSRIPRMLNRICTGALVIRDSIHNKTGVDFKQNQTFRIL